MALKLHNEKALDDLIARQQDPAAPVYRNFIDPTELLGRFAPSQADVAAVTDYPQSERLVVLRSLTVSWWWALSAKSCRSCCKARQAEASVRAPTKGFQSGPLRILVIF